MKYVVAVSGGVDSVVLLDVLTKKAEHELLVAHFDHGIREDSAADARFVEALANRYGLVFLTKREELGERASEDMARERRYAFLQDIAHSHGATVITAHHRDDVIETIAINLTRGTGWRGLAVMSDLAIERPLLEWTKQEVYEYALKHRLEWVEDATNHSTVYLRNRIRSKLGKVPAKKKTNLFTLFQKQCALAEKIDAQTKELATTSRYFLTMVDDVVATEPLRAVLSVAEVSATRPQRQRLLHAVRTAKPGTTFEVGGGISAEFGSRDFIVKHP